MNNDFTFWLVLIGSALVRVVTSPFHSVWRAALTILTAVFVAWLLTDAAVDWLHLNPAVYRVPMGGLIALTADGLVRAALSASRDPLGTVLALLGRSRSKGE